MMRCSICNTKDHKDFDCPIEEDPWFDDRKVEGDIESKSLEQRAVEPEVARQGPNIFRSLLNLLF